MEKKIVLIEVNWEWVWLSLRQDNIHLGRLWLPLSSGSLTIQVIPFLGVKLYLANLFPVSLKIQSIKRKKIKANLITPDLIVWNICKKWLVSWFLWARTCLYVPYCHWTSVDKADLKLRAAFQIRLQEQPICFLSYGQVAFSDPSLYL